MPDITSEENTVSVGFEWDEVNGSLDEAYRKAMDVVDVKNLNPGSDYTEQYYTIEVSAAYVEFIFRREYCISCDRTSDLCNCE